MRFAQPDTLVPDASTPQSLNRYSYALNNPIRYNDPTGHCIEPISLVICAAVAFGFFAMSIDYANQVLTGHTEYIGFGCMFQRCGGFADYLRDRGAIVWGSSSVVNAITLGAVTPEGAIAVLGEENVTLGPSGQATPLVTGPVGVGLVTGTANAAETVLEKGLLKEPLTAKDVGKSFGYGLVSGAITVGLDSAANQDISDAQQEANEAFNQQYNPFKVARPLPQTTNFSQFANLGAKVSETVTTLVSRTDDIIKQVWQWITH